MIDWVISLLGFYFSVTVYRMNYETISFDFFFIIILNNEMTHHALA
jgi:hypothetical protein